jgi:hypothetical protein
VLQAKRRKELDEMRMEHAVAAERSRSQTEGKERECDSVAKRLELARHETSAALTDRVRLEIEQKALVLELKREQDALNRRVKDYNAALKRARRAEVAMQQARQLVPHERLQAQEATRQLNAKRSEKAQQLESIEEMRREVDIYINKCAPSGCMLSFCGRDGLGPWRAVLSVARASSWACAGALS